MAQLDRTASSKPTVTNKAPPAICTIVSVSSVNSADEITPTSTSVIKSRPTRAGSSRAVAHTKASMEPIHQTSAVTNTQVSVDTSSKALKGKAASASINPSGTPTTSAPIMKV